MCQPLHVANKRRLYSLPSLSPGSSGISRVAEKKKDFGEKKEEKERTLLIKRIKMENEKGRGKARVKREAFIVSGAQCISAILLSAAIFQCIQEGPMRKCLHLLHCYTAERVFFTCTSTVFLL